MSMRKQVMAALAAAALSAGAASAGDLGIRVLVSGEVAPGVYGQVQIGNDAPPPPVVYAQPMLIEPQPAALPPVYLHVPPGHARNWRKHCHEYHACNRPVYFVRSSEYDPPRERHEDHDEHDRDHHRDHEDHGDHDHGERGHGDHEHGDHDRE